MSLSEIKRPDKNNTKDRPFEHRFQFGYLIHAHASTHESDSSGDESTSPHSRSNC